NLQNEFNSEKQELHIGDDFGSESGWKIIVKKAVGIFNYKKSLLYQDYKKILVNPSKSVHSIFLEGQSAIKEKTVFSPFLHELDDSQKVAVNLSLKDNAVIQGPPGTGKSHTVVS